MSEPTLESYNTDVQEELFTAVAMGGTAAWTPRRR